MFFLAIFALILFVGGVIAMVTAGKGSAVKGGGAIVAGLGLLGTIGFGIAACTYTQDAGEAAVVKDITGNIVGSSTETGLHGKAPWDDVIKFNIRNQQVIFAEAATAANGGAQPDGPQITVQDADGVSSNVDVALRYSIQPSAVITIYKQFQSAENFRTSFIEQDIRSVVRDVPNKFHTLELLTNRTAVEAGIQQALENRWSKDGVSVDSVSLQEIRPPASVVAAYSAAQQAQIKVTTEQNNLKAAQVAAQQQVVQAEAQAKANGVLERSLTPQVLKQHTLDTLAKLAAKGNLVITDGTGSTLLNVNR